MRKVRPKGRTGNVPPGLAGTPYIWERSVVVSRVEKVRCRPESSAIRLETSSTRNPMKLVSIPANPVPEGATVGTVKTSDGAVLRFARFDPPAGRKGTLVVLQGRAEFI